MALTGDGFFVVQDGQVQSLTRAGNFQLDKAGNLITSDGQSVMGFAASNGTVNESGSLTPITIPIKWNWHCEGYLDLFGGYQSQLLGCGRERRSTHR